MTFQKSTQFAVMVGMPRSTTFAVMFRSISTPNTVARPTSCMRSTVTTVTPPR